MQIGIFTKAANGYAGRLRSLTLNMPLTLLPAQTGGHRKMPDWRVYLTEDGGAIEVGAGWTKQGRACGSFLAIEIDCPGFARPLRANLLPSTRKDGEHVLLWSPRLRRPKAVASDAEA